MFQADTSPEKHGNGSVNGLTAPAPASEISGESGRAVVEEEEGGADLQPASSVHVVHVGSVPLCKHGDSQLDRVLQCQQQLPLPEFVKELLLILDITRMSPALRDLPMFAPGSHAVQTAASRRTQGPSVALNAVDQAHF